MKMEFKLLPLFLLLPVFLIGLVYASPTIVSAQNIIYEMNNTASLGFQSVPETYVLLTVSSGFLNSSSNTLTITRDSGIFRFTAINNTSLDITYTVDDVRWDADPISNGETVTILAGETHILHWAIFLEPFFPVMFILGMIGLCSMVGGGLYGAHKIKKGEYYEGGRMGLIYVSVGLGLFLAWVFMEVV